MKWGTEFKVGVFALVALTTLGYMFFVISTPEPVQTNCECKCEEETK